MSYDFFGTSFSEQGRVDDRQRPGRDKQMDEKYRKLEEIKQQAAATQRFREEHDAERQRRMEDSRRRDTERRMIVENRRSVDPDSHRRNEERETRLEVRRKNEQGSIGLAFGSASSKSCDTGDSSYGRRSASTYNVAAASDERENFVPRVARLRSEASDELRNRAKSLLGLDSAGTADMSRQHGVSLSMYEVFQWSDPEESLYPVRTPERVEENGRAQPRIDSEFSQLYRKTFDAASQKLVHLSGHIHGSGCEVIDETMSQSFHGSGSSAFRRRTDIMPTIPSPHRDLRPRSGNPSLSTSMHEHVTPKSPTRRSLQHASNSRSMSHINEVPKKQPPPPPVESLQKVAGHRSMGNLGPQENGSTPENTVQRKTSLSTPRLTRAERLRQRAKQAGAEKKKMSTPDANPGFRSGDVTPTTPSRPLSAMSYRSHSGSSGAVSLRPRPATATRRPRPASMAGTGILAVAEIEPEKKEEKKEEAVKTPRPRLPTFGPKPSRAKSMDLLGTSPKPLSTYRKPRSTTKTADGAKPEAKPSPKPDVVRSESKVMQKTEPKTPKLDLKAKPQIVEKAKVSDVKTTPKAAPKSKPGTPSPATPTPAPAKAKPTVVPAAIPKEEAKTEAAELLPVETEAAPETEAALATEAVPLEPVLAAAVQETSPIPVVEVEPEQSVVVETAVRSRSNEPAAVEPASEQQSSAKPKITSEEGAKAAIAEKRRLAREQMEREAELERQRLEAERLAEEERLRQEEEQAKRDAEEMEKLLVEQRKAEEERLQRAIEDAQKRQQEEQEKREEEARQRAEREVADRKAREEAEKQRKENEERLRKEEEARVERKKRVEAIMSRTRGSKQGQAESSSDEKSLTSLAGSESSNELQSLGDEKGASSQGANLTDEEIVAMKNEINLNKEFAENSHSLESNASEVLNGKSLENVINGHQSDVNGGANVNGGSALIDLGSLGDVANGALEALAEINQETVKPLVKEFETADLLM